jgi:hypothetical protein
MPSSQSLVSVLSWIASPFDVTSANAHGAFDTRTSLVLSSIEVSISPGLSEVKRRFRLPIQPRRYNIDPDE